MQSLKRIFKRKQPSNIITLGDTLWVKTPNGGYVSLQLVEIHYEKYGLVTATLTNEHLFQTQRIF